MKNINFSKYYDEAIFGGMILLIALVIWYAYKYFSKASGETRVIEIDESNLTITPTQAQLIADNLFTAMDRQGTEEQTIYDEFDKISSMEDMLIVSEKFGQKKYFGGYEGEIFGQPKNLKAWIFAEMTEGEIEPIKNKLNWI